MDDFTCELQGFQEMADKVRNLPRNLAVGAFALGFTQAAAIMMPALNSTCPDRAENARDENNKHLSDTIASQIHIQNDGSGGRLWIGFKGMIGGYKAADIARYVEWGHRMVGHAPTRKFTGKYVAPYPFIRIAWADSLEPAVQAFIDVINAALPAALEKVA